MKPETLEQVKDLESQGKLIIRGDRAHSVITEWSFPVKRLCELAEKFNKTVYDVAVYCGVIHKPVSKSGDALRNVDLGGR